MNNPVASLALLKVNWDERHKDHIDSFVPFIVTLMDRRKYERVVPESLCADFQEEFGLSIPYHAMVTILNRVKKSGYITQPHRGLYIPDKNRIHNDAFTDVAMVQTRRHRNLVKTLVSYCESEYQITLSEEDAESALIDFLREHDLDVLFASKNPTSILPDARTAREVRYLVQSFIVEVYESEPALFDFVSDMAIGHIVANALLLNNGDNLSGSLDSCSFYLDTGLLFSLMGINGPEKQNAYQDFVRTLRATEARIFVFRHTYEEYVGILENCLQWIESARYDPLKASRALQYFKDNGYTSSDVEQFINSVDRRLSELEISIADGPTPMVDQRHQIDELALQDQILALYNANGPGFDELGKEYTVAQDVRSIAAVHRARKGWKPTKIGEAGHAFVTTNTTLAYASRCYETNIEGYAPTTIPVVLTDVFVGTLLWIRSPEKAEINEKRLIANCYAALQPNPALVKRLVDTAEDLLEKGHVTEDEVILLKESRVARSLLQRETLGDPDRFSSKTVETILDEIQAEIRTEEQKKYQDAEKSHIALLNELERQKQLADEQKALETRKRQTVEANLATAVGKVARILARLAFAGLMLVGIVLAIFAGFPQIFEGKPILKTILGIVSAILFLASLATGFNLKGTRDSIEAKLSKLFMSYFGHVAHD